MSRPAGSAIGETGKEQAERILSEDKHKETLAQHKRIIKHLKEENKNLRFRNEWLDSLAERPEPKPIKLRKQRKQKKLPEAVFHSMASDWHVEERVRPETVGHKNEYNPEIAAERAEHYTRSCLKLLDIARKSWYIPRYCQGLNGDFITGHLHLESIQENYLAPTEATLLALSFIENHIDSLLRTDLELIVLPCNYGNHGRLNSKPQHAVGHVNNLEWMMYRLLEKKYENEPRIDFRVANGYEIVTDFFGYLTKWHHGDMIRYRGGIGGLTVPLYNRKARQAMGFDVVHRDAFGHHHQLGFPQRAITNGSMIGFNSYAQSNGFALERPLQASWVVDEEHREAFWPIEVV